MGESDVPSPCSDPALEHHQWTGVETVSSVPAASCRSQLMRERPVMQTSNKSAQDDRVSMADTLRGDQE